MTCCEVWFYKNVIVRIKQRLIKNESALCILLVYHSRSLRTGTIQLPGSMQVSPGSEHICIPAGCLANMLNTIYLLRLTVTVRETHICNNTFSLYHLRLNRVDTVDDIIVSASENCYSHCVHQKL